MARVNNLSNFLTDVADAIRTKKETTGQIPAENFDQEILSIETGMPVYIADEPLDCVVRGAGKTLDDLERLKTILINSRKRR